MVAKPKSTNKTEELSAEDQELYAALGGSAPSDSVKMAFLTMNIASEDDDGNEIPVKTFTLSGTKQYSKSVRFRPLAYHIKMIAMKQDGKVWKTTNETIFYTQTEQPIDARGGLGCGRLLGKAIPESWTEEQKKANKAKATYYGFLFGLVEFPGQEAVLCNFRIPAGKAVQVSNVINDLKKNHGGNFEAYMLNMKLATNPKDKSSPHPILEIEPDLSTKLPLSGITETLRTIKAYIEQHNTRIRTSHQNAKLARKSLESDASVSESVETLLFE